VSEVTSRSQHIDKSRCESPLKQFGLKMSAKSVHRRCRTCIDRKAIPCRSGRGSESTSSSDRTMVNSWNDQVRGWWRSQPMMTPALWHRDKLRMRYAGAWPWRQRYTYQWRRDGVCRPGQTSLLPPPSPQSDLQLIVLWLQRWH